MKRWLIAILINAIIWNIILGHISMYPGVNDDFYLGGRYQPNQLIVNRTEGYAVNMTNSLGFVDDEFMPNRNNILVLGDSVTEANQVFREATYPVLLEKALKQQGFDYSVHNLGIKGKSAADYIAYGPAYLEYFNPEYVLIQLSRIDLVDSYRAIGTNAYIDENYTIVPYTHFDGLYRIKNMVASANPLFFNTYLKLKKHLIARPDLPFVQSKLLPDAQSRSKFDYQKADAVIDLLKNTYQEKLIVLYISPISLKEQINGAYEDSTDQQYDKHLKQYCNENNIKYISTADRFISQYARYGTIINGFANSQYGQGHLNQEGHKVLSQIVLSFFEHHLQSDTYVSKGGQ